MLVFVRSTASAATRLPRPFLIAVCLTAWAGCAHRHEVRSGSSHAVIGDSVCAMLTRVTLDVVDGRGAPVADAEVWRVETFDATPPIPERAHFHGRTDANGRLVTSHCYAGADDLYAWQRRDHATRLSFLVMHEQAGYRRVAAEPSITDVYRDGDPRESRVGRPVSYGYELAVRVELPGTR